MFLFNIKLSFVSFHFNAIITLQAQEELWHLNDCMNFVFFSYFFDVYSIRNVKFGIH